MVYAALCLTRGFFEFLPPLLVRLMAWGLGEMLVVVGPRRRSSIQRLRDHMPSPLSMAQARRIIDNNYRHFAQMAIEFMRLRLLRDQRRRRAMIRARNARWLFAPAPKGRLVVTSHMGNFVYSAAGPALAGADVAIVVKHVKNAGLERFWVKQLESVGIQVLFNRDSMRDILRVLRRGGILGFIYDQHDSRGGVWVDFMGDIAAAFRALPSLSVRTGLPVLPGYSFRRRSGRHELVFSPEITVPVGDDEHVVRELAQRYSDVIADSVRAHPEQWLWLHRRWRKPPADASLSERAQRLLTLG